MPEPRIPELTFPHMSYGPFSAPHDLRILLHRSISGIRVVGDYEAFVKKISSDVRCCEGCRSSFGFIEL